MTTTAPRYWLIPTSDGLRVEVRPRPAHRAVMTADSAMANLLTDALSLPDWRGKHWAPITSLAARLAEIHSGAPVLA